MDVVCDQCGAKLRIPQDKLPEGARISARCPRCGARVSVETENATPASPLHIPSPPWEPVPIEELPFAQGEEALPSALLVEGEELLPNQVERVMATLGYRPYRVKGFQEAQRLLSVHPFELVILSGVDGGSFHEDPLHAYFNQLPMSVRRRIFLCLIDPAFKSLDTMTAFALSVNLVIHPQDLDRLEELLRSALSEHEKFYKIYQEELAQSGRHN